MSVFRFYFDLFPACHKLSSLLKKEGKSLLFLFILNGVALNIQSQTLELGILFGGSNYQGDLASSELRVLTKQTDQAFGGFLRYNINEQFSIKLQVVKTELHADDANSSYEPLKQRNLRFFSPLLDASLRVEWQFLERFSKYQQRVSPYIALGGSFFTFNPQAEYQGEIHELQPLNTEGQGLESFPNRKPYNLYNASILGGVGIKFLVNEDLTIGFDLSANYAFTDYLDDVHSTYADYDELAFTYGLTSANISYQVDDFFEIEQIAPLPDTQRGNPRTNDLFLIAGITLSYNLINPERSSGKGIGCPTF